MCAFISFTLSYQTRLKIISCSALSYFCDESISNKKCFKTLTPGGAVVEPGEASGGEAAVS